MIRHQSQTKKATAGRIVLASAILLLLLETAAPAQQTLGDLVREGGFEWLPGRWTAIVGENTEVELTYRWAIKDQLITVDFKTGEYAYHGMIFLSPEEGQVVEIGMDSRGVYAKSIWEPDGMDAVSTSRRVDQQGHVQRVAFVHSRVDDDTMELTLHMVDENGVRAKEASVVMVYKRNAIKVAGEAAGKAKEKSGESVEVGVEAKK